MKLGIIFAKVKRIDILIPVICLLIALALIFGKCTWIGKFSPGFQVGGSFVAQSTVITLHYHERPPYYVTGPDGVHGLCADPARLVFEKAGIPFRWQKTPARRQLKILQENQANDCLLGWFKKPEREEYATYSACIYRDKPDIAVARADNDKLESDKGLVDILADKSMLLLRKQSYSYGAFIDEKIALYHPRQEISNSENIELLKMILAGRADYLFISEDEADWLTALPQLARADFKYIRFRDMPAGNQRYLLFSKRVEPGLVERINQAICKYVKPSQGGTSQ